MNKEKVLVITDREELYDKCENMEQLFSEYYLPLLDVHYRKTYDLQNRIDKANIMIEKIKTDLYSQMAECYENEDEYNGDFLNNEISKINKSLEILGGENNE